MTLQAWMAETGKTQAEVAEGLEVDQSAVSLWLNGKRRPNGDLRLKIQQFTRGKVGVEVWAKKAAASRRSAA